MQFSYLYFISSMQNFVSEKHKKTKQKPKLKIVEVHNSQELEEVRALHNHSIS